MEDDFVHATKHSQGPPPVIGFRRRVGQEGDVCVARVVWHVASTVGFLINRGCRELVPPCARRGARSKGHPANQYGNLPYRRGDLER